MRRFETNPPMKDKVLLLYALKRDMNACSMLKLNTEQNNITAIYDDGSLCEGALILGNKKSAYLYCFFDNPDYCVERYHTELKSIIVETFLGIELFDVHCLKNKFVT